MSGAASQRGGCVDPRGARATISQLDGFSAASARPLPGGFFARSAIAVARDLLGAIIESHVGGEPTAGIIVETEAYLGADDPGSHAATRGITQRNQVMYGPPGCAYVYFTYGSHHMLNLVTEDEGVAGAVLVRAIEPVTGIETMSARRGGRVGIALTNGPGKLAEALGVDRALNGVTLGGDLRVCEGVAVCDARVVVTGRVGLSRGHELPLRFYVRGNPYVSKGRTGPRASKRCRDSAEKGSA